MAREKFKKDKAGDPKPHPELISIIAEIQADIGTIEKDAPLFDEINFNSRTEAIDNIDFHIIDRIDTLLQNVGQVEELVELRRHAKIVKTQLEKINDSLFRRLQEEIKTGDCKGAACRDMIGAYIWDHLKDGPEQNEPGYDHLDTFTNGLLPIQTVPEEIKEKAPGMVFYQKTPGRIILELVDKAQFKKDDVFYDLGSGLGHVPILVNLLSGVRAKGVEFEPAYCDYATACATELNLPGVQFINADARSADYSDGTVFFMYTPFEGGMLLDVLEMLRLASRSRNITILTYGPCTVEVARQSWLGGKDRGENNIYKLGVFSSFTP